MLIIWLGRYPAMTTKRFLLVALVALIMVGVALHIAPPSSRRYRADSLVVAKPFTNALSGRSFEAHVIRTIPGVLRLQVSPTFSGVPTPGLPAITNGMGIRIVAFGPTPEGAQQAANEAATQLSRTVLTNYGVSGETVDMATSARRYSYFHDSFQPAVGRIFKH
jgi:hypothetical protein